MAAGATHYFTGEPCKHGHIAPRKTKGACVECQKIEWEKNNQKRTEYFQSYNKSESGKAAKKKYYENNKEKLKQYNQEYYEANKDKIKEGWNSLFKK